MSELKPVIPVKPVCGILIAPDLAPYPIIKALEELLGPIEERSETFEFDDFTQYYQKEMGKGLQKFWVSFRNLKKAGFLAETKCQTNEIESRFSVDSGRRVNLDPGYITAAKLVLASAKDFAHRVYLGRHIYGDVQLRYIRGEYRPSEWTYPDYQSDMGLEFFTRIRERFNTQEKNLCKTE